jgi:uncharacterized repeat protein (TIGR01451 family)
MRIVNTATANPPPLGVCAPGAAPPCIASTVTPVVSIVSVSKSVSDASGDGIAERGETLTYTIVVRNSGGSDAINYGVTDPLDANTTFVSATPPATLANGILTWTRLTIPAGENLVLTVVVTVNSSIPAGTQTITNLAYTTGTPPPDCTVQPVPESCAIVPLGPPASVGIAKSANTDQLAPSGTVIYTVTVSNTGDNAATDVRVSDPLPAGIAAFAWTCAAVHNAICPAATGDGPLDETVASLPTDAEVVYTIIATLTASPPDTVTNTANVSIQSGACAPCSASVSGHLGLAPPPPPSGPALVPLLDRWSLCLLIGLLACVGAAKVKRERRGRSDLHMPVIGCLRA